MFKNKKQVDVTEFELMKKRMDNLEKQLFELKKKTDAEEQKKAFDEWYQKQLTRTVKELHRIADS